MASVRFASNTKMITQVPYLKRRRDQVTPTKRVLFRETIIPTKNHDGSNTDTKNTIIEATMKNVYDNIDIIMEMWKYEYISVDSTASRQADDRDDAGEWYFGGWAF